jgi:hypothetical protein
MNFIIARPTSFAGPEACVSAPQPPNTALWPNPPPPGSHDFAQAFLDTNPAFGALKKGYVGTTPAVAQSTHHSICNGTPGCCQAVTLWTDLAPGGGGPEPLRNTVNWPIVIGTGAAAATVVTLFVLALRHAGRTRR